MEVLTLHTGSPTVHLEDNTIFISVVEAKIVTPIVKHIYIPVCFLLEQFYNRLPVPKYKKYRIMPEDMCTKPCSDPIIGRDNKWITSFILYPTIDTEHYQLMI